MLPIIAIIGRPNVGKSTIFNCLTKTRDAIVANQPGLTRDRQYGYASFGERNFIVVDTGGLDDENSPLNKQVKQQVQFAICEAEIILFVVDAKTSLTSTDEEIARQLRIANKLVFLVVNKIDGLDEAIAMADFYQLGFPNNLAISAAHNEGIRELLKNISENLPMAELPAEQIDSIKIGVIGKPNAGKSTLINSILGQERVTVFDEPGTTRDTLYIPFERKGKSYLLIDTAGVRRKSRVHEKVEKLSVIKALQAIDESHVIVFLIDAVQNISEQDLKLLGLVLNRGNALVIAVNKWDAVTEEEKERVKSELQRRLKFIDFATWHFISAKEKKGISNLFQSIDRGYQSSMQALSSAKLTQILEKAVAKHEPPLVSGRRIKLRYAHPGGKNPPTVVIHGNQVDRLPNAYKRYLESVYRKTLNLSGTPIRIELRKNKNPFLRSR